MTLSAIEISASIPTTPPSAPPVMVSPESVTSTAVAATVGPIAPPSITDRPAPAPRISTDRSTTTTSVNVPAHTSITSSSAAAAIASVSVG